LVLNCKIIEIKLVSGKAFDRSEKWVNCSCNASRCCITTICFKIFKFIDLVFKCGNGIDIWLKFHVPINQRSRCNIYTPTESVVKILISIICYVLFIWSTWTSSLYRLWNIDTINCYNYEADQNQEIGFRRHEKL